MELLLSASWEEGPDEPLDLAGGCPLHLGTQYFYVVCVSVAETAADTPEVVMHASTHHVRIHGLLCHRACHVTLCEGLCHSSLPTLELVLRSCSSRGKPCGGDTKIMQY